MRSSRCELGRTGQLRKAQACGHSRQLFRGGLRFGCYRGRIGRQ
jgi:hypothetical protein